MQIYLWQNLMHKQILHNHGYDNLNVLLKKKKGQKISAYLGSCTFHIKVKKLKSWRDNLEYVYLCVNTFRFGWFDLNGTLCRQRPCRFGCEYVIGLSPNPFSFGNSCLMIYNMWLHFQVWFRMAWNSIYFEKTIPFVPCMKYDFCAFFPPPLFEDFLNRKHGLNCDMPQAVGQ